MLPTLYRKLLKEIAEEIKIGYREASCESSSRRHCASKARVNVADDNLVRSI